MTTDRDGNPLQKGDIVLVEMVVGDVFINAPSEREILLTRDEEGSGVPPLAVYTSAVHVTKKEDQTRQAAGTAPRTASAGAGKKVLVTAPGAPKNTDGTLNTKGATKNANGTFTYPDGTVRNPDGSVV